MEKIAAVLLMKFKIFNQQEGCKKPRTAKNPGQEFIQNRGTIYPPFIQYITPSAPIETDEVTLYSVLIVGL